MALALSILEDSYEIIRLSPEEPILSSFLEKPFVSITRTEEEISIVAKEGLFQSWNVTVEKGCRIIKVEGPLDFTLTGVVSSLTVPLAAAGISVFVISTYDTDYLLVKSNFLQRAIAVLRDSGFII